MRTWWLSYADEDRNLGVAIVDAESCQAAIAKANALGIHPGGEVLAIEGPVPGADEEVEAEIASLGGRDRLIGKDALLSKNYHPYQELPRHHQEKLERSLVVGKAILIPDGSGEPEGLCEPDP